MLQNCHGLQSDAMHQDTNQLLANNWQREINLTAIAAVLSLKIVSLRPHAAGWSLLNVWQL